MDYGTRLPYGSQSTAVQNLETTIEELEERLRLLRAASPAPSTETIRAPRPPRPMRSSLRSAPLPPKVSTGREFAELDGAVNVAGNGTVEVREREELRAHLKIRAPPAAADVATNTTKNAENRKNEERLDVAPKLTIKIRPRISLQDRFSVRIVPVNNHTTLWDVNNQYVSPPLKESPSSLTSLSSDSRYLYAWAGMLVVQDVWPTGYTHVRDVIKDFAIDFRAIAEPITDPSQSDSFLLNPEYDIWNISYRHALRTDHPNSPDSQASKQDEILVDSSYSREKSEQPGGPLTWRIKFWVPVPAHLFAHAEHKTFVCQASVLIRHTDCGAQQTVPVWAENIAVGIERLYTRRLCCTEDPALPHDCA